MNWVALGHLVKAAGYALFREDGDDEEVESGYGDRAHAQRQPRRESPAPKRAKLKKSCCVARR